MLYVVSSGAMIFDCLLSSAEFHSAEKLWCHIDYLLSPFIRTALKPG